MVFTSVTITSLRLISKSFVTIKDINKPLVITKFQTDSFKTVENSSDSKSIRIRYTHIYAQLERVKTLGHWCITYETISTSSSSCFFWNLKMSIHFVSGNTVIYSQNLSINASKWSKSNRRMDWGLRDERSNVPAQPFKSNIAISDTKSDFWHDLPSILAFERWLNKSEWRV